MFFDDPQPLGRADVLEWVAEMAAELRMETPRLSFVEDPPLGSPAATNSQGPPFDIHVHEGFLADHEHLPHGVWAVVAHEVGHVFWLQYGNAASGFPEEFEDEDGADYVAGQLAARFGRPFEAGRDYLCILIACGARAAPGYRDPFMRMRVFQTGYENYVWGRHSVIPA